MITIVLDNTKSLVDSDIYQPLLYRSMRQQQSFYIKHSENNRINKVKSIVKYYPEVDYEIVVLLDLSKIGESLIEKVYQINNEIITEVFTEVKQAIKIRYIVLDYINGNYMHLEREFLKEIDSLSSSQLENYIFNINKENREITWTQTMNEPEHFSVKALFIEKVLPLAEVDIITLNKLPNEEKEIFYRDIYLKIYGFIDLIAEGIIVEDVTNCCYKELPIYKLNIDLNYEAIEETAKRYWLNLENEEKNIDLSSFEKIEQVPVFLTDEKETILHKEIIDSINGVKLNLKPPKVTLFRSKKDLKILEKYIEQANQEYKKQLQKLKSIYGMECRNARDDLNKDFSGLKTVVLERFEVENKIKEEKQCIEKLKRKKTKPLINTQDENTQYDDFLEEKGEKLTSLINNRKNVFSSLKFQLLLVVMYIIFLAILLYIIVAPEQRLNQYIVNTICIVFGVWIAIALWTFVKYKNRIKQAYKTFIKEFSKLFYEATVRQRAGVENVALTRSSIKCEKKIEYLQKLLDRANERIEKADSHKYIVRNHKNFAKLLMGNATLDGSISIQDLDSTYELNINIEQKYRNKAYSFLDYIVFKKYKLSLKNASTSRVAKIENAETYIAYVSIE